MAARRRAPKPLDSIEAGSRLAGISHALGRIEAMAWLIDNIHVGELGFLDPAGKDRNATAPAWWSVEGLKAGDVGYSLEQSAVESIGRAAQEIRAALRELHPSDGSL